MKTRKTHRKLCVRKCCSPKKSSTVMEFVSTHCPRPPQATLCPGGAAHPTTSETSTLKIREGRCSDGKGATYSNHLNNFNLHTHSHRYQCFENRLFSPKKQLCSVFFSVPHVSARAGPPTLRHGSSKVVIQNSTPCLFLFGLCILQERSVGSDYADGYCLVL